MAVVSEKTPETAADDNATGVLGQSILPWGRKIVRSWKEPAAPTPEPTVAPAAPAPSQPIESVSWSLRVAAAWSWRLLVVLATGSLLVYLLYQLQIIVVPVLVALLLTVLLAKPTDFLVNRLRFPRTLATTVTVLGTLIVVVGALSAAGTQLISGAAGLFEKAQQGLGEAAKWLTTGPLGLDKAQLDDWVSQINGEITGLLMSNKSSIASGALSLTSSMTALVAGFITCLFCVFFFLKEGRTIWLWFVRLLPAPARGPVDEACLRGLFTLSAYARTQMLVAAIDATGIGLGAWLLGVPMALPIAVLVFLGSFIPVVGAMITGVIAVLVALVDQGIGIALAMLVIILLVQQLEGNVLQPMLMSGAVSLHPVAVLLVVAGGSYLAGILGALFSVPILAFMNVVVLYLHGYDKFPELESDEKRPGGPPGSLADQLLTTFGSPNVAPAIPVLTDDCGQAEDEDCLEGDPGAEVSGKAAEGKAEKAEATGDNLSSGTGQRQ